MRVFQDFNELKAIPNPVLTIGTFDGVHIGHQKIIEQLNQEAEKIGGESVLFTFYPHPRMVLFPDSHGLKLIQTQSEKVDKLRRMGLKNVIVVPFTKEFSRLSAIEFVRDYLVNQINVKKLVIGYDHQFGKNREGTLEFLKDVSETYGFEVIEIPAQEIDDVNVSSTKIRTALNCGDIETANLYLGESFSITGEVIHGDALGQTIGFPTANLEVIGDLKLIPANGVYAVLVEHDDRIYPGMMNIGTRPTVSAGDEQRLEVHIFDFHHEIYGQSITVQLLQRIREERRFEDLEDLQNQLKLDEKVVRSFILSDTV